MEIISDHEAIHSIDLINEGVDWFKLINGSSKLDVAKRIKATTTEMLVFLSRDKVPSSDSKSQRYLAHYFAKKELAHRLANDGDPNGDPKYKKKYHGYEKISWPPHGKKDVAESVALFENESIDEQLELASEASLRDVNIGVNELRLAKIASLVLNTDLNNTMKAFIKAENTELNISALALKESWDSYYSYVIDEAVKLGKTVKIKAVLPYGAIKAGTILSGTWIKTSFENQLRISIKDLPLATLHPTIFYDKSKKDLQIPKQFKLL